MVKYYCKLNCGKKAVVAVQGADLARSTGVAFSFQVFIPLRVSQIGIVKGREGMLESKR